MPDEEAQPLLCELYAFQSSEPFIYRHPWSPGMLTMWDNRAVRRHPFAVISVRFGVTCLPVPFAVLSIACATRYPLAIASCAER